MIVTDVKAVDNGEWKFSIRSEAILNGTVKTYRHKVEIIQKGMSNNKFRNWSRNLKISCCDIKKLLTRINLYVQ